MIELAAARFPGARGGVNACRANSNSNRKGKTMKEEETTIGTGKRAPGGVQTHVHKVDGEGRLIAVVEVSGNAYARLGAIAKAMWHSNKGFDVSPSSVFGALIESRLDDLAIGIDEGTNKVIGDVCDYNANFFGYEYDIGEVERAVMKSLDA